MRAWLMNSYDGVERLQLGEVTDPHSGPKEVLLQVKCAALNPADAFLAQAMYPAKPSLPHILGRDGVGAVLEVGPDVKQVRVGETVGILRCEVGVNMWGTLAEKVVVPAESVIRPPDGWSIEETAGAPLVFLTAWQALTQWSDPPAPPPAGSVLLVTGASGGVGVASVLLGKSMNLIVVALTRSAEKGNRLKALGADVVCEPADRNLTRTVMAAMGQKRGIDLVIDNVGGALLNRVIPLLGYGGRISVVGRSAGAVPEFNTANLLFRRNRIGGVYVGDYATDQAHGAWKEIVDRLHAMGKRPIIDTIVPFEDVKKGFDRLAQGPMGKIVVRIAKER